MSKSFVGKEVRAVVRPGIIAVGVPFTIVDTVVCEEDGDGKNILCLLRHTNEKGQHVWALSSGAEDELDDEGITFAGQTTIGMTDGKGVPPTMAAALREMADKIDALAGAKNEHPLDLFQDGEKGQAASDATSYTESASGYIDNAIEELGCATE